MYHPVSYFTDVEPGISSRSWRRVQVGAQAGQSGSAIPAVFTTMSSCQRQILHVCHVVSQVHESCMSRPYSCFPSRSVATSTLISPISTLLVLLMSPPTSWLPSHSCLLSFFCLHFLMCLVSWAVRAFWGDNERACLGLLMPSKQNAIHSVA